MSAAEQLVRGESSAARYFAHVRIFTGGPVARAYVRDRVTGTVVAACPHRHRSRRANRWDRNGCVTMNAATLAARCAAKLLRSFLRDRAEDDRLRGAAEDARVDEARGK